jgi:hypothetical protein
MVQRMINSSPVAARINAPGKLPAPPKRADVTALCDRCQLRIERTTREEIVALGWVHKHPDDPASLYGWRCPSCIGQPLMVQTKAKRRGWHG